MRSSHAPLKELQKAFTTEVTEVAEVRAVADTGEATKASTSFTGKRDQT